MCVQSAWCECHLNFSLNTQLSQSGQLGYAGQLNQHDAELFKLTKYFRKPEVIMYTGKEFLIVDNVGIVETAKTLEEANKKATERAHKSQGSVYIFRPYFEIAPKRDVVKTIIELDD